MINWTAAKTVTTNEMLLPTDETNPLFLMPTVAAVVETVMNCQICPAADSVTMTMPEMTTWISMSVWKTAAAIPADMTLDVVMTINEHPMRAQMVSLVLSFDFVAVKNAD